MKKVLFGLLSLYSVSLFANDIVATPEEMAALTAGAVGLQERINDEALSQDNTEGCWTDKSTQVNVGTDAVFENVASTCVLWNKDDEGKSTFIFIPARLVAECDAAGLAYSDCLK